MSLKLRLKNAAGKRGTLVTIQTATDATRTASGDVNPQYLTEFSRYVEEMITSGREFQQAMQVVAMLQGILRLPFDDKTAAISARDRVAVNGRVLNLAAPPINDGGRNETIILWVAEVEQ